MSIDVSPLFEPLFTDKVTLKNRIVMPPMVVCRGIGTPEAIEWYGRRARGGVSLVIIEATSVMRFSSELTAEVLRPQVEAIHAGGALAAIQLFPWIFGQEVSPTDLSTAEIEALVTDYARAARICAQAGFDGIEPHGAHGYLLNQFFSPEQNRRTDDYGPDSLGQRMRLALRVVEAVRPACDKDMLLLYRHTPVGRGYGLEDSLAFARALVEAGVDILDLSPSSQERPGDLAAPFAELGAPVITVGNLDVVERALEVLAEKRADLVAVGTGLIADPDWPRKVKEGRFDEIVACTSCGSCSDDLRERRPVGCVLWE